MPRGSYDVFPAIMPLVDWRKYSGLELFDNTNGETIAIPVFTLSGIGAGSGLFPSIIEAITGRYVGGFNTTEVIEKTYPALHFAIWYAFTQASWGDLDISDVDVGIDANDKVYIELPGAFTIIAGGEAKRWGFSSTANTVAVSVGGGMYRATAPWDWVRGDFQMKFARITISATGHGTATAMDYSWKRWALDVSCAVRSVARTNIADPTRPLAGYGPYSLASASDLGTTTAAGSVIWGIDDSGHVFYISSEDDPLTWKTTTLARELRYKLGFVTETTQLIGDFTHAYYKHTASLPCAWLLTFSRPFDRIDPTVIPLGTAARLTNGSTSSVSYGTAYGWSIAGWLDGPSDTYDRHMHFIRKVGPLMGPGRPIAIVQDWGDSRRARRVDDGASYNVDATIEQNGYRGTIFGSVVENGGSFSVSWPNTIRQRSPFSLEIYQTLF